MKQPLLTGVFVLTLMLSATGQAQDWVCPSGKAGPGPPLRRVVVLRPRIIMENDAGKESKGASEQVEIGFHSVLTRVFEEKGYEPWLDPTLIPDWEQAPQNDGAVRKLKDRFDSLLSNPFGEHPKV